MTIYLIAFGIGCLGFWLLQLGLRPKSPKQKMHEAMTPNLEWMNSKEKSYRIYLGIVFLIISIALLFV